VVSQGDIDPDPTPRPANLSWITGDQIFIAPVTPSIQNMNDRSKYELFACYNTSRLPLWTKDFSKIRPRVDWNNITGCVTMTYDAPPWIWDDPAGNQTAFCSTSSAGFYLRGTNQVAARLMADRPHRSWRISVREYLKLHRNGNAQRLNGATLIG
jgi:hypothetical protein